MKKRILALLIALVLVFCSCSSIPKDMLESAKADAKAGGLASRAYLSKKEKYDYLKALTKFIYEDVRAKEKSPLPAKIDVDVNGKKVQYIIYPKQAMDENQCLQLAQLSLDEEKLKKLQPPSDVISYEDAKTHAQELLKEYSFNIEIDSVYPSFTNEFGDIKAFWSVMVQAKSGYDYEVDFYAKSGQLKRITRKAQGEYSKEETPPLNAAKDFSDDEVLKAAEKYYNAHDFIKTDNAIIIEELISDEKGTTAFAVFKGVNFYTNNTNVIVYIDMANLSVCGVRQNI